MKLYYVRTRNWNGNEKVAKLLKESQPLYGYEIYENIDDSDHKYFMVTNNKAWAERCFNWFSQCYPMTGGITNWYSLVFDESKADAIYTELGNCEEKAA